jgi:hypothetical protein
MDDVNLIWIKTHSRYNPFAPFPSMNTVHEFESAIEETTSWPMVRQWPPACARISQKCRERWPSQYGRTRVPFITHAGAWRFAILMGIFDIDKTFPYFFSRGLKAIYLFDAWEHHFELIQRVIRQRGIQVVFFCARQSCERFTAPPGVRTFWLPEGTGSELYHAAPYEKKDVDVIDFGRRFEPFHAALAGAAERLGIRLLSGSQGGQVLFPDFRLFADALGRSKICVCFPSSLTHPKRSGTISTMTHRYLQAMLSKCLIVGATPDDMQELFPYAPVVEADLSDPAGQVRSILADYGRYVPLVERNCQHVLHNHLWDHRIRSIRSLLGEAAGG